MSTPRQTIVILGGGIGGLRCVLELAKRIDSSTNEIILIDKEPYHLIRNHLYECVTEKTPTQTMALPFKNTVTDPPIRFIQDLVTKIDPVNQRITLHRQRTMSYDYLVVALGGVPNDHALPGLTHEALFFNNLPDALMLRQRLVAESRKKEKVHIIIAGGGSTGIELALRLGEFSKPKKAKSQSLRVDIIEKEAHLLTGFPREIVAAVERKLKQLDISFYGSVNIKKIQHKQVVLSDKRALPFDLLLWTGGVKAHSILQNAGFEVDESGRVIVDSALRARGFSRVYVIGDSASFIYRGKKLSSLATIARSQGSLTARNIARQLRGSRPISFRPGVPFNLLALSSKQGIIRYGQLIISGRLPMTIKHWLDLFYLASILPFPLLWHHLLTKGSRD